MQISALINNYHIININISSYKKRKMRDNGIVYLHELYTHLYTIGISAKRRYPRMHEQYALA